MISSGAFQAVVAFVSNLILVRHISPSQFGIFAIILSNATLLSAFSNLRIGDLILRSKENELKSELSSYYAYTILQSIIILVGGLILLKIVGQLNFEALIILVAVTFAPFIQINMVQYERNLKYVSIAKIESTSVLLSHFMAVIGVLCGLGAIVLYLRVFLQSFFVAIGLYINKAWAKFPKLYFSSDSIFKIFKNSKWIWLDNNLEQGLDKLIIIFSNSIAGSASVGMFFQAKRLSVTPHQLLQPFTTRVLLNYLSKEDAKGKINLLNRILKFEIIALGIASVFINYFGLELISFLFGPNWIPVYDILVALLGIVFFLSIFNSFKAYYISEKNTKLFTFYGRIPLVIGIIVSYISIKIFISFSPIIALAYAISAGYAIASIFIFTKYNIDIRNAQHV